MARQSLAVVERYFAEMSTAPIIQLPTAADVRSAFAEPLPRHATPFPEALATVRDVIYPLSRHDGHPRFFGYVASPGSAVATMGDLLTAALNANVTSWRSAPAPAEIEHLVIEWIKTAIGFPASGAGQLVSGGSMANFSGLAAARSAKAPDFTRTGDFGPRKPRLYISREGHFSNHKAARLLGYGVENVRTVAVDARFRMDLRDLERQIRADAAAGYAPACVVANAGTTNTGAIDPLAGVADIARRYGMWMHVDGAYGGFARLAPSAREKLAGVELADSVSLDPHKWLYATMGCGCVLYRDPAVARATFAYDADYTRPIGLEHDEAFVFWDFGPELSRPFRALTVWLQFKVHGADALAAAMERNMACARRLAQLVEEAPDMELLAPVELSVVCFRHRPKGFAGELDAFNERLLVELQRGGSSYLSNTRIDGAFALRACVLNYRTTESDIDRLMEDVRAAGARVSSTA